MITIRLLTSNFNNEIDTIESLSHPHFNIASIERANRHGLVLPPLIFSEKVRMIYMSAILKSK